jgi:hypothetical protein
MEIRLTAVFRKFPESYAAFVEELPGANTQALRSRKRPRISKKQWPWFCK